MDGWNMYVDISEDATRMGIDLKKSKYFRLFDNSQF